MNVFLLMFPLAMAVELRTLVYQDKLRIYPAKKIGDKILPSFEEQRNVGLSMRRKKFVLKAESHLTINHFWKLLGREDAELAKGSHALRMDDSRLYMSLFKSPVDNVTLFSVILASLKMPENCHVNLVVDDNEVKKIAKDAVQAFVNVGLKLKHILPKTLVLALDGYIKGIITKRYVLTISTGGEKGVFCFYATDIVGEDQKAKPTSDASKGEDKKQGAEAESKSEVQKKKDVNGGEALKLVFVHETELISDVAIKKIMYEFIRGFVEKAYNKFRTEKRSLEPVEVGYYPFDDGEKRPEYYFLVEEIAEEMIHVVQKRAPTYVRIEIIIYNSSGKQLGVLTSQEFHLEELYRKLDEYCDRHRDAVVAFEENLVNSMLGAIDDKSVTAGDLLKHVDVVCNGISMQLNLVKQFFKTLEIKNREFVTYYGTSGNYYEQYKIRDDRVYRVTSVPVSTKMYKDIMHEVELYERSSSILGKHSKILYDHPIVNTYKDLRSRIEQDVSDLTLDQYNDFVDNYVRVGKDYDPKELEMAHAALCNQFKEVEALKKKEPEIHKAVESTYKKVKDWYKEHGKTIQVTYRDIVNQKSELMHLISALRRDKVTREMNEAKEKERLEAEKKAAKAALTREKAKKAAAFVEETGLDQITKNVLLAGVNGIDFFKDLVGMTSKDKHEYDVQQRDAFGEMSRRTKYVQDIPHLVRLSSDGGDNAVSSWEEVNFDARKGMEKLMGLLKDAGPLIDNSNDSILDYEKVLRGMQEKLASLGAANFGDRKGRDKKQRSISHEEL